MTCAEIKFKFLSRENNLRRLIVRDQSPESFEGHSEWSEKRETLVSDHILLKWSLTKAVLILVPLKKSPCLKCPEMHVFTGCLVISIMSTLQFPVHVSMLIKNPGGKQGGGLQS